MEAAKVRAAEAREAAEAARKNLVDCAMRQREEVETTLVLRKVRVQKDVQEAQERLQSLTATEKDALEALHRAKEEVKALQQQLKGFRAEEAKLSESGQPPALVGGLCLKDFALIDSDCDSDECDDQVRRLNLDSADADKIRAITRGVRRFGARFGLHSPKNRCSSPCTSARIEPCTSGRIEPCTSGRIEPCTTARIEPCASGRVEPCASGRVEPCTSGLRARATALDKEVELAIAAVEQAEQRANLLSSQTELATVRAKIAATEDLLACGTAAIIDLVAVQIQVADERTKAAADKDRADVALKAVHEARPP